MWDCYYSLTVDLVSLAVLLHFISPQGKEKSNNNQKLEHCQLRVLIIFTSSAGKTKQKKKKHDDWSKANT